MTRTVASGVAIAVLVAFAIFVVYLLRWLIVQEPGDLPWTRAIYLFTGVEAIAFAAAGFLFGREVNRERAETAENAAAEARESHDEAKTEVDRMKGQAAALNKLVTQKIENPPLKQQPFEAMNLTARDVVPLTQADLNEIHEIVKGMAT